MKRMIAAALTFAALPLFASHRRNLTINMEDRELVNLVRLDLRSLR